MATWYDGYDLDRAAQASAFFAMKEGGSINTAKLSKLLYLTERESMRVYEEPMFYDDLISMTDGPATSVTLKFINGINIGEPWSRLLGPKLGFEISLSSNLISLDDLDHLSIADMEIIENLWGKFGKFDQYQLSDWTRCHENIPEWRSPQGSSCSIECADVFRALGKNNPDRLADDVLGHRAVAEVFTSLRNLTN